MREDMEIAQVKNAQAPRNKPHEVEEATGTLSITRKCFRHLALDYVLQINVLQAKKKFEILDAMLSFMHAQYSLFQQGYNLLDEIDPYMKKLAAELDQLVIDSAMEKRDMEHKHATIQQRVSKQLFHISPFPLEVGEVWVWDWLCWPVGYTKKQDQGVSQKISLKWARSN
ncbi:unnamed protein product [Oncorhynchus mykiss]|uniref:Arf-GAP with coiled-coil, ANK repeat and PH domain-containing protein n=1 Tax=Oncorhynchus mykiss TaxID=8022 RepID=A0A060Y4K5_ONCMY|nr:unnamed protein product [Oncorhynchus mykiss]